MRLLWYFSNSVAEGEILLKILKPEWMMVGNKRCKIGSLFSIGIKGLVSPTLRKAVGVALEK